MPAPSKPAAALRRAAVEYDRPGAPPPGRYATRKESTMPAPPPPAIARAARTIRAYGRARRAGAAHKAALEAAARAMTGADTPPPLFPNGAAARAADVEAVE